MSALTSLLVRDQVVPVRKIEEALQRQVVSGGEIETVLLEMGAVAENVLAAYAAATLGLRPATRDEVMGAPRDVVRIVPREVAEKHRLVPIAVEGRILYVAVAAALSTEVDQELGFLLGFDLVPRVVTEARLIAALAQHYGVEPLPRLARLAEKLKERDAGAVPYVAPLASRVAEQYLPSERRRVGFGAFDDDEEEDDADAEAPRPAPQWSTPATKPDAERVSRASAPVFEETVERATQPFGFAVVTERDTLQGRPRTWSGPAAAPSVAPEALPPMPMAGVPAEATPEADGRATTIDALPPDVGDTSDDRAALAPPEPPASMRAAAPQAASPQPAAPQAASTRPAALEPMPSLSAPPPAPSWRPAPAARAPAGVNTLLVALGAPTDRPARSSAPAPLSAPPPSATASERRASGFFARLRAPLGLRDVSELLQEAETRNEVLATFFAFARQFFDYTALFVVQDDVAEGRESSGPGANTEEIERIAISLEAGGLFADVRRDGVGRIASLDGTERDRALASRMRRTATAPCAVLPLTIRRRVVLILHGDRSGDALALDDLPELLGVMPRVSEAFERLILRRKFTHSDGGTREAPDTDRAPPLDAPTVTSSTASAAVDMVQSVPAAVDVAPSVPPAATPRADGPSSPPPAVARTEAAPLTAQRAAIIEPQREVIVTAQLVAAPLGTAPLVTAPIIAAPLVSAPIIAARTRRASSGALSVLGVPRSAPPPPSPKRPGAPTPAPFAVPGPAPVPLIAQALASYDGPLSEADPSDAAPIRRPSTPAQAAALGVAIADDDDDVIVEMSSGGSDDDDDDDDLDDFDDRGAPVDPAAADPAAADPAAEPARTSSPRIDGSYSVRGASEEVITARQRAPGRTSAPPATSRTSAPPARSAASTPATSTPAPSRSAPNASSPAASPSSTSGRPAARVDPRSDGSAAPTSERMRVTPSASPTSERLTKETRPETPSSRDKRKGASPSDEPSVIVDMGENVEAMIVELTSSAPDEESNIMARLLRLGDAALPTLVRYFPGPLWFDRRTPHARLPRGRDVSAIARALVAFRERAAPYVASLLDGKEADSRFYATLLASEIVNGALLDALGRRVFDEDAGTRLLALDVLKRYQHLPEYASVLEMVRATARILHRDLARRRTAIRALAELRDARAAAMLITVLDDEDEGVRGEAHRALVVLTKQDFGDQRKRWEQWADKHAQRHRIEWLIDALLHNDEPIRASAGEELKRLTQEYYGYHPGSPRRERERVHGKYQQWWDSEGKAKF